MLENITVCFDDVRLKEDNVIRPLAAVVDGLYLVVTEWKQRRETDCLPEFPPTDQTKTSRLRRLLYRYPR